MCGFYYFYEKQKIKDLYAFTNLGWAFGSDPDNGTKRSFLMDFGIGWQKMFRRHFGLNFQIGYHMKQFGTRVYEGPFYDEDYGYLTNYLGVKPMWSHGLTFGVGLVF